MAQELPVFDPSSVAQPTPTRQGDVAQGIWIEVATIFWMTVEASIALTVGFATRIAKRMGSAALKADAACSVTCAYMSLTLLVGLLLNRLLGWWWADPLAALALVYFLVQEGRETLHEACTGEMCSCGDDDCRE